MVKLLNRPWSSHQRAPVSLKGLGFSQAIKLAKSMRLQPLEVEASHSEAAFTRPFSLFLITTIFCERDNLKASKLVLSKPYPA
jgi:hypothetical protein